MANKRMFSLSVVDTDAFLDMPSSSRLLYYDLAMRADDEGFVGNPKKITRESGAGDDAFRILIAKKFIIPFESGICVIKHWLIHNTVRMDRFHGTTYINEKSQLIIKDNKAYKLMEIKESGNQLATMVPQSNLIKSNLIQSNINKDIVINDKSSFGEFKNVKLKEEELNKLIERFGENNTKLLIEELSIGIESKGYKYKSHYATLLNWARRKVDNYKQNNKPKRTIV